MFFHILNHLLNVSQVCFEMVGYSLGSFVGTSSWPAFPTCKDASLLLIFSYNKFCMRFSLDTSPHAHFYGKSGRGGGVVGFACPTPPLLAFLRWDWWRKAFPIPTCSLCCCSCAVVQTLLSCSLECPGPISYPLELPLLCPTCVAT